MNNRLYDLYVAGWGYLAAGSSRYEQLKKRISQKIGKIVWDLLNYIGNVNSQGLLYKRLNRRLQNYYDTLQSDEGEVNVAVGGRKYAVSLEGDIGTPFYNAFNRRFYGYSKILLLIFIMGYIDYSYNNAINLSVYGLLLDGIGALIIARSLFQGESRIMMRANVNSHIVPGPHDDQKLNSDHLIDEAHNSVDAIWGGFIFAIGISLQMINSVNISFPGV